MNEQNTKPNDWNTMKIEENTEEEELIKMKAIMRLLAGYFLLLLIFKIIDAFGKIKEVVKND